MQARHFEAVIFSIKAAAALAGVLAYQMLELPGTSWVAAVSAVLVTQRSLHSPPNASRLRKAVGFLFNKPSGGRNAQEKPGTSPE